MKRRPRIVLQLAALLDLALNIIFVQAIQVQTSIHDHVVTADGIASEAESKADEAEREKQGAQKLRDQFSIGIETKNARISELEGELKKLASQVDQYSATLKDRDESLATTRERTARLDDVLASVLRLDTDGVTRVLEQLPSGTAKQLDEKLASVHAQPDAGTLVRMLGEYMDIQSVVDVWRLYIAQDGTFSLEIRDERKFESEFATVDDDLKALLIKHSQESRPRRGPVVIFCSFHSNSPWKSRRLLNSSKQADVVGALNDLHSGSEFIFANQGINDNF
ncbi:MAG: hypothetical protein SGI88_11745 [Candidatus Hydrogenedentes bacterium]|nr:hypothetical protein [Candidatus Hydrogenedentota bacterium]